jgi:hypothetical protein
MMTNESRAALIRINAGLLWDAKVKASLEVAMSVLPASTSTLPPGGGEDLMAETTCVWTSASKAWVEYLARLATARSPLAAFEAGADFLSESLQIGDRATITRLRGAGVVSPLLSDS